MFAPTVTAQQGGDTIGSIRGTHPHVTPKRQTRAAHAPAKRPIETRQLVVTQRRRPVRSVPVRTQSATHHTTHPIRRTVIATRKKLTHQATAVASALQSEDVPLQVNPVSKTVFLDDFHDPSQSRLNWIVDQNGGSVHFNQGAVALKDDPPDLDHDLQNAGKFYDQSGFPVVLLRQNPFPATGDWTLCFTILYNKGGPPNPDGVTVSSTHGSVLSTFTQDNTGEYATLYSDRGWAGGVCSGPHQVQLQKRGRQISLCVDGKMCISAPLREEHTTIQLGGSLTHDSRKWNNFDLQAIQVTSDSEVNLQPRPAPLGQVRYAGRPGFGWHMVGGRFQGSNDGVHYTDLYTITDDPLEYRWVTALLPVNPTIFRYLRYLSPPGGYGNAAEIEFDSGAGPSAIKLTGTPFGSGGSWNNEGKDYTKALDGDLSSYFDGPNNGNGCGYFVGIDRGSQAVDDTLKRHNSRMTISTLRQDAIYPHAVTFGDNFHDPTASMNQYNVENNGGIISFSPQGLALHGVGGGFPVLAIKSNPFRASDLWTASFVFRYTSLGTYGTELRIEADDGRLIAMVHQDTNGMFAEVNDHVLWSTPINYKLHTVSFTHRSDYIAIFVDGKEVGDGQTPDNGTASRIKVGGGLMGQALGWNDLELRAIVVRQGVHVDATNLEADGG